jgi:hypothetical protein
MPASPSRTARRIIITPTGTSPTQVQGCGRIVDQVTDHPGHRTAMALRHRLDRSVSSFWRASTQLQSSCVSRAWRVCATAFAPGALADAGTERQRSTR